MKLFRSSTMILALGVILVTGTVAQAARTFAQNTQDGTTLKYHWSEPTNWSDDTLPVAGEEAIIPEDTVATVDTSDDTAIAGYLTIQQDTGTGGIVEIAAGKKLTLDGDDTARTSTIAAGAFLYLRGNDSFLEIKDDNHTFSGSGRIVGQHNNAEVNRASTETLTVDTNMTMSGAMQMKLSVVNNGKIIADDSRTSQDTLELFSGTFTGSGEYRAVQSFGTSDATMKFASGITATGLTGDFTLSVNSVMDVDEDVCTTGDLTFDGGKIEVAPTKTFTAG